MREMSTAEKGGEGPPPVLTHDTLWEARPGALNPLSAGPLFPSVSSLFSTSSVFQPPVTSRLDFLLFLYVCLGQ